MRKRPRESDDASAELRLREAAQALAEAAGQFGQTLGTAGTQAETGVTKGLLAAAQALAQASAWVEQRSRPLSTRERLLEQAIRLFGEHGYAGVSLEDIAQAAGFTKGAVYSHFGSKEQTFLAALRAATASLGDIAVDSDGSDPGEPQAATADPLEAPEHSNEQRAAISRAVDLAVEAMLFGRRVSERREEVREIVSELVMALAAADRRLAAQEGPAVRELDRDESRVAQLALRTMLLRLSEGGS